MSLLIQHPFSFRNSSFFHTLRSIKRKATRRSAKHCVEFLWIIGVCVLVTGGCKDRSQPETARQSSSNAVLPDSKSPIINSTDSNHLDLSRSGSIGNQVTRQQAQEFAENWVKSIREGNEAELNSLLDWNSIVDRTLIGLPGNDSFVSGFKKGLLESKMGARLGAEIFEILNIGGDYSMVRVVQRDGYYHAIFRLLAPETGINYHDLRIVQVNGQTKADRIFIAVTGEETADTLRSFAMPMANSSGLVGRLTGKQKQEAEAAAMFASFNQAVKAGKTLEALKLYHQLPESRQQSKLGLLLMITLSSQVDDKSHLEALEKYAAKFPNDPSLDLILLDTAALKKDWEMLEQSRLAIKNWTGGDPLIDLLCAAVLSESSQAEDLRKAAEIADGIDASELNLMAAHDYKLVVALANQDFPKVLAELEIIQDVYQIDLAFIEDDGDAALFRQSKEYQKIKSRN